MSEPVRSGTREDVAAIVRLINEAYLVEADFVSGDRTNPATIWRLLETGVFLVIDGATAESGSSLDGCVYVERLDEARAYFGMLAVSPSAQGRGLGRVLIEAAEAQARREGASAMDIRVVSLRTELFPFYGRFGYVAVETEPYTEPRALQPFHFVRMRKVL